MKLHDMFSQNWLIIAIFITSLLFSYSYIDFSSNMSVGTGHVYLAKSLALDRTFNLDNYWQNAGVDIITVNGHYYLPYAPLNAVLMAIPYFTLQVVYYFYTNFVGTINGEISIVLESLALSLTSSLALFGILLILKKYVEKSLKLSKSQLNLLLLATAFGTLLFIYSLSFFHHIISAFFIFAAFYLLNTQKKNKYLYAGILVGLAFLTEFLTVFFSIALLIAEITNFIYRKKSFKQIFFDLLQFAIPVAIAIIIMLTYNQFIFGGFLTFGERIFVEQRIAIDKEYGSFSENPLYGIYGALFSPLKGLFTYSPFLIFIFWGFKSFFRNNKYQATLATTYILIMVILYPTWSDCFGATVYGIRYLVGIIPFLCLITAYAFEPVYKSSLLKTIFIATIVISIFVNTTNALFGIAQGKMGECDIYLNTYSPYHRITENLIIRDTIKTAPVLINYYRTNYFP